MGGIMKAISTLLRKNTTNAASQSGARVPIVIDKTVDNESISAINGSASMSELMQVLGGVVTTLNSSNDLNDIKTPGLYFWSGSAAAPANAFSNYGSWVFVWQSSTNTQILQIQIPNTAGAGSGTSFTGIGLRKFWNGSWDEQWAKIQTIPQSLALASFYYNYSTLAELKAALNALP